MIELANDFRLCHRLLAERLREPSARDRMRGRCHRPHSRQHRHRHLRYYPDRTGARRGPCRHTPAQGEATAIHPGTPYSAAHSSGNRGSCSSRWTNRRRESRQGSAPSTFRSVDWGNSFGTRLQRSDRQPSPLPTNSRPIGHPALGQSLRTARWGALQLLYVASALMCGSGFGADL